VSPTPAHALIAVDASANRSKGARDPALWLPTNTAYHCEYVRNWIDVKNKYNLDMDAAELATIESVLGKSLSEGKRAEVLGIRSAAGDSTARFAFGMRKNNECGYSSLATNSDSLMLTISITPEAEHLESPIDIFLVLALDNQVLVLTPTGELVPFSGDINDLVAFVSEVTLKESFEFTLFECVFDAGIELNLFVAYMSKSGNFVFTPQPLNLKVVTN
jgi:hypothetical protein